MGHELDSTLASFPSYAELSQTQAWHSAAPRVKADTNEAAEAAEVSHGSRYTEGAVLGTGGMGKVLLARDARIGRDIALKVLHPERELDPDDRARFLREAQVQGQLEHPSIVPVYDIERRLDGTTFFTMRRVHGRTLGAILDDLRKGVPAAKARFTQRELLTAFGTVCLSIDYAHTRGVVHRDLKPANIMLGEFGEVYVLDWGLARLVDEAGDTFEEPQARISMPGSFLGTPLYMAPEQMAAPEVGPTADVYSLGLILFEILTLERGRDPNALYVPVDARPSVRVPHRNIAPELETICVKATEGDPKDRYPSARALQEAINRYLEGDREIAQRKHLASEHVKAARIALGKATQSGTNIEKERTVAMSELTRAVALDPTNTEHVAMLADFMANPPPTPPAAVVDEARRETMRILRLGARQSIIAMFMWLACLPICLYIGFADAQQTWIVAVPMVLTALVSWLVTREARMRRWTQWGSIIMVMATAVAAARSYGPFLVVPTIIVTNAVVLQAHPVRSMQRFGVAAAIAATLGAIALEYFGAWPQSYVFEDGSWRIVPQLLQLPRDGTFLFLTVAGIAMIIVPSSFIARLRNDLTDAQMRLATQAWQFKQLGAQLVSKPEPT